jgi:hypothetical protein
MPRTDCNHTKSSNPRRAHLCLKCGATIAEKIPEIAVQNGQTRPRNLQLEEYLIDIAAQASGFYSSDGKKGVDGGLHKYADWRARPGDVVIKDRTRSVRDKIADTANNVLWDLELIHDRYLAGDAKASDDHERLLRTLAGLISAWHNYKTPSS